MKWRWITVLIQSHHDISENRARSGDSRHSGHWRIVKIANPNTNGKIRRVAYRPIISEVRRRTRFCGTWKGEIERASEAKRRGAGKIVRKNVGDQIDKAGVGNRSKRCRILGPC